MRRMYSENQIKKLAKFVAQNDLSDVDLNVASINAKGMVITGTGAITGDLAVGGAITSKTLKQSEANYLYEFEITLNDTENFEQVGEQYCRIEEVNGEIHIIGAAMFKNIDTANAHSFRLNTYFRKTLPPELASKIYGMNGSLSEANAGYIRLMSCHTVIVEVPYDVKSSPILLSGSSTPNEIQFYQSGSHSIPANDTAFISFECNLSVL